LLPKKKKKKKEKKLIKKQTQKKNKGKNKGKLKQTHPGNNAKVLRIRIRIHKAGAIKILDVIKIKGFRV